MRRTESSNSPIIMRSESPVRLLSRSKKETPRAQNQISKKKTKKRTASSLDSTASPTLKSNRVALQKKKTYDFAAKS